MSLSLSSSLKNSNNNNNKNITLNTLLAFGPNFFFNQGSDRIDLQPQNHCQQQQRQQQQHKEDAKNDSSSTEEKEERIHIEQPFEISLTCRKLASSHVDYDDEEEEIKDISLSHTHTTILTSKGNIFNVGTLNGIVYPKPTFMKIELPLRCIQIACGKRHVLALMESGVVLSWGGGFFGQLGHGMDVTCLEAPKIIQRLLPQNLGDVVSSIYAGPYHSSCITNSHRSFSWGCNRKYQCGVTSSLPDNDSDSNDDSHNSTIPEPLPIHTSTKFISMSLGHHHSLGLTPDGIVFIWGGVNDPYDDRGGIVGDLGAAVPTVVKPLTVRKIVQTAAGDRHSLALADDGSVYSWGTNKDGQLGHGHLMHILSPRLIAEFVMNNSEKGKAPSTSARALNIEQVFAAGNCSAVLTSTGDVYSWGFGTEGQLGTKMSPSHLQFLETPGKTGPGNRIQECYGFDSSYNVILPKRVEYTRHASFHVQKVFLGANCMMLSCTTKRSYSEQQQQKLLETEEEKEQSYDEHVQLQQEPPVTRYEAFLENKMRGLARLKVMASNRILEETNDGIAIESIDIPPSTSTDILDSISALDLSAAPPNQPINNTQNKCNTTLNRSSTTTQPIKQPLGFTKAESITKLTSSIRDKSSAAAKKVFNVISGSNNSGTGSK